MGEPQSEPLHLSGVWRFGAIEEADQIMQGNAPGFVYRRDGHPNASSLAEILRQLHGADRALLTAQGMSALAAVALGLLQPGDRVLLGQPAYGKTGLLFDREMSRWGVRCERIPCCDIDSWDRALRSPARLAIVETITNPRMQVPDLSAISHLVHREGTLLLVDNTFATPLLCRPIEHGADLVMESLSKIVCGHSDAMIGLLCGTDAAWERMESTSSIFGLASSPLDCWLTKRGLTTLPLRLERSCANALALANTLHHHGTIVQVDYPGLIDHPQHALATEQFGGRYGNMLTIHLRSDQPSEGGNIANRFIKSLSPQIPFCPSLGEAQTTLSHPRSTSHRSATWEQLEELGISDTTIRISCGIEETEWLCQRFLASLENGF